MGQPGAGTGPVEEKIEEGKTGVTRQETDKKPGCTR